MRHVPSRHDEGSGLTHGGHACAIEQFARAEVDEACRSSRVRQFPCDSPVRVPFGRGSENGGYVASRPRSCFLSSSNVGVSYLGFGTDTKSTETFAGGRWLMFTLSGTSRHRLHLDVRLQDVHSRRPLRSQRRKPRAMAPSGPRAATRVSHHGVQAPRLRTSQRALTIHCACGRPPSHAARRSHSSSPTHQRRCAGRIGGTSRVVRHLPAPT
jgi:hypothetical protein